MEEKLYCRQCAVWKPKEQVTFSVVEEALWHLITVHPNRAMWIFLELGNLEGFVHEALRDRCKEGELL
jgi:hypothetical protein